MCDPQELPLSGFGKRAFSDRTGRTLKTLFPEKRWSPDLEVSGIRILDYCSCSNFGVVAVQLMVISLSSCSCGVPTTPKKEFRKESRKV